MNQSNTTLNGVSVITCTNKRQFVRNILLNYRRQNLKDKELIIVINNDQLSSAPFEKLTSFLKNVSVYKVSGKWSLGRCLNFAVSKAEFPIISKFDDDDYYAPGYLRDMVLAMNKTRASIVGKRSYFTYLEGKRILMIRFPNNENKFTKYIAGGTITFRKTLFNEVKFRNVSLAEDVYFYRDCQQKGYKIFSTNRYNYVYLRRKAQLHTWKVSDQLLMRSSRIIAKTLNYVPFIKRSNPHFFGK